MPKAGVATDAQLRILVALRGHGGIFDRHRRIVAGGEVVTRHGSSAPLSCFINGLISMRAGRVVCTFKGARLADETKAADELVQATLGRA